MQINKISEDLKIGLHQICPKWFGVGDVYRSLLPKFLTPISTYRLQKSSSQRFWLQFPVFSVLEVMLIRFLSVLLLFGFPQRDAVGTVRRLLKSVVTYRQLSCNHSQNFDFRSHVNALPFNFVAFWVLIRRLLKSLGWVYLSLFPISTYRLQKSSSQRFLPSISCFFILEVTSEVGCYLSPIIL